MTSVTTSMYFPAHDDATSLTLSLNVSAAEACNNNNRAMSSQFPTRPRQRWSTLHSLVSWRNCVLYDINYCSCRCILGPSCSRPASAEVGGSRRKTTKGLPLKNILIPTNAELDLEHDKRFSLLLSDSQ